MMKQEDSNGFGNIKAGDHCKYCLALGLIRGSENINDFKCLQREEESSVD